MDIKDSIFKLLRLDNLVSNLTGYLEAQVKLAKMEVRDELVKVLARGLLLSTVMLLAFLFLLFLSVGLAHYLNGFFQQPSMGYWVVAGIYGVPCLIFILFRNSISRALEKYFAQQIKKKEQ